MFNKRLLKIISNEFTMDTGAPMPVVLSDDHKVIVIFYSAIKDDNWDGTYVYVRSNNDPGIVCITFNNYTQYKFGYPNDEAYNGHPYYKYGLKPYSFNELINSDWIHQIEMMNRVHPNHSKDLFENDRHFIIYFHDSCFEIISKNYKVEINENKHMTEVINNKIGILNK